MWTEYLGEGFCCRGRQWERKTVGEAEKGQSISWRGESWNRELLSSDIRDKSVSSCEADAVGTPGVPIYVQNTTEKWLKDHSFECGREIKAKFKKYFFRL